MKRYIQPEISVIEMETTEIMILSKDNQLGVSSDEELDMQLKGRNRSNGWGEYLGDTNPWDDYNGRTRE
jgi:hypothetical protein